jgi:hypothetical protein
VLLVEKFLGSDVLSVCCTDPSNGILLAIRHRGRCCWGPAASTGLSWIERAGDRLEKWAVVLEKIIRVFDDLRKQK